MKIEQAIFTSVRGQSREGYQVAAISPGVSASISQELSRWGPAHDSLNEDSLATGSINFHPLGDDTLCISKTVCAGAEYSGRGGERVYTQMLLVKRDEFGRFANHPFRLLEAVQAIGKLQVLEQIPRELEAIEVFGRARDGDRTLVARLQSEISPEKLDVLVRTVKSVQALTVFSLVPPERLFSGLMDMLEVEKRADVSFSTGLKHSPRRPFRLLALPNDSQIRRRVVKTSGSMSLDLAEDEAAASR